MFLTSGVYYRSVLTVFGAASLLKTAISEDPDDRKKRKPNKLKRNPYGTPYKGKIWGKIFLHDKKAL